METAAPCDAPVRMTQFIETGANENTLINDGFKPDLGLKKKNVSIIVGPTMHQSSFP